MRMLTETESLRETEMCPSRGHGYLLLYSFVHQGHRMQGKMKSAISLDVRTQDSLEAFLGGLYASLFCMKWALVGGWSE